MFQWPWTVTSKPVYPRIAVIIDDVKSAPTITSHDLIKPSRLLKQIAAKNTHVQGVENFGVVIASHLKVTWERPLYFSPDSLFWSSCKIMHTIPLFWHISINFLDMFIFASTQTLSQCLSMAHGLIYSHLVIIIRYDKHYSYFDQNYFDKGFPNKLIIFHSNIWSLETISCMNHFSYF